MNIHIEYKTATVQFTPDILISIDVI